MDPAAVPGAAEDFGEAVALVKAHLVGRDRVADSNVVQAVDDAERVFVGMGVLPPPWDPETLCLLLENSNSLRQNIDAYVTNIDAFGHRFEPIVDLDASDADQRIANALYIERLKLKEDPRRRDDPAVRALAPAATSSTPGGSRSNCARSPPRSTPTRSSKTTTSATSTRSASRSGCRGGTGDLARGA